MWRDNGSCVKVCELYTGPGTAASVFVTSGIFWICKQWNSVSPREALNTVCFSVWQQKCAPQKCAFQSGNRNVQIVDDIVTAAVTFCRPGCLTLVSWVYLSMIFSKNI